MKCRLAIAVCVLAMASFSGSTKAQNNECDEPGEKPDIIVGSIPNLNNYGAANGMRGFSIGTTSCNIGTCWADWLQGDSGRHPVIGQNLFRLKDGRFEHIGQSWLKHGFATLNGSLCGSCIPTAGQHLGVNCSDPYDANLNGSQGNLGPKFEVNVKSGTHLHPFTDQGSTGDNAYKRLQVAETDLEPSLNPGAKYYVEAQYVTKDETEARNNWNNNSYREVTVSGALSLQLVGSTVREKAAIFAWSTADPTVDVNEIDRLYIAAAKATDLGNGTWHYEYAVQNIIDASASRVLEIPIPHNVTISNIGFHAPHYHSGEPFSNAPWTASIDTGVTPNVLRFETETVGQNPNASALRWGTLYNFRFDANYGPTEDALLSLLPFNSGSTRKWTTFGPDRCGDAFCDFDENEGTCSIDCAVGGVAGEVPNGDDVPGTMLLLETEPNGDVFLSWGDSCWIGDADYEVYEGTIGDFASHTSKTCSTGGISSTVITPGAGDTYYLVVPSNGDREGSYGRDSAGTERPQGVAACQSQMAGACL